MRRYIVHGGRRFWALAVRVDASIAVLSLTATALLMLLAESDSLHPKSIIIGIILGVTPGVLAGWVLGSLEGRQISEELMKSREVRRTWRDPHPAAAIAEGLGLLLAAAFGLMRARELALSAIYFVATFATAVSGARGWRLHLFGVHSSSRVQVAWGNGLPWAGLPWTQRLYRTVSSTAFHRSA